SISHTMGSRLADAELAELSASPLFRDSSRSHPRPYHIYYYVWPRGIFPDGLSRLAELLSRKRTGPLAQLQVAHQKIEARLSDRHLGADERVLRLQKIELGHRARVVLHAHEAERLARQVHRAPRRFECLAFGVDGAARQAHVVSDGRLQELEPQLI